LTEQTFAKKNQHSEYMLIYPLAYCCSSGMANMAVTHNFESEP
jgi:hypothetical protein